MPKLSAKRQITLPIDQCRALKLEPGDEVESYVYENQLTIIKKVKGAAAGLLKDTLSDPNLSDEESLQSHFE